MRGSWSSILGSTLLTSRAMLCSIVSRSLEPMQRSWAVVGSPYTLAAGQSERSTAGRAAPWAAFRVRRATQFMSAPHRATRPVASAFRWATKNDAAVSAASGSGSDSWRKISFLRGLPICAQCKQQPQATCCESFAHLHFESQHRNIYRPARPLTRSNPAQDARRPPSQHPFLVFCDVRVSQTEIVDETRTLRGHGLLLRTKKTGSPTFPRDRTNAARGGKGIRAAKTERVFDFVGGPDR